MAATIWFGTKEHAQWVECPRINMDAGKVGWETITKFLNGGSYVRRSTTAAREYILEWGLKSRDALRPIMDYADFLYGAGDIYWCDPMAMDKNMLPAYWAAPFMNGVDGPLVSSTTRPVNTDLLTSTNGYPTRRGGIHGTHSIYIPIPPGYTAHVGVHSDVAMGGTLRVHTTINGVRQVSPTTLTALTTASTTRTNATFAAAVANRGIEIENVGNVVYSGMIVQILKTGTSVAAGGFISGQGHSGLQFAAQPSYFEYSAGNDLVQASAQLIEVGAWR